MAVFDDDLGTAVRLPPGGARRVVSLVPSLTEAVASRDAAVLVGATRWCTHPVGLAVQRIGGTKNPDLTAVIGLAPDLVLANEEENKERDLTALRDAGLSVWVTRVRSLPEAFSSLDRMLTLACGLGRPTWLDTAAAAWDRAGRVRRRARLAVVPIWRRPWMVLGRDTFAGDLLARLGVANVYQDHAERYPKVALADLRSSGADLVVLPDEPYAFSRADGPEAFGGIDVALVSGRHLTWYGPSLEHAADLLDGQLSSSFRPAGERRSSPGA